MDTEKLVHNSLLTLLARVAMLVATAVGLPAAGWFMNKIVDKADTIAAKVDDSAIKIQLLDQSVKYGFDAAKGDIAGIKTQLGDHEGRIRLIERDTGRRAQ